MIVRRGAGVAFICAFALSPALADDLTRAAPLGREVTAIMDVLRVGKADPPAECVQALDEMNTTEQQLRILAGQIQDDNETDPVKTQQAQEAGLARDVLASDFLTAVTTCRPTALALCVPGAAPDVATSCAKLQRVEHGGGPARGGAGRSG